MIGAKRKTQRSRGLAVSIGLVLGLAGWSVATAQTATDYTTYYRYDAMGRVEMKIGPDPDGAGTRARAAEKSVYYDNGRLKQTIAGTTTQIDGSNFTAIQTVTYEYDLAGNKVLETSPAGVTQFGYDGMNRPTCTAVRMDPNTFGGLAAVDPCVLASSVLGAYGPDRITENHYDPAGQLERVSRGVGTSIQQDWSTTTYTTNGKIKTTADANGNTSTYIYDAFDRLTKLEFPSKARDGTSNALDYEAYGYDDNGNRASLRKRDGLSFAYDYDALNRQTIKHYPGDTTKDVYTHYDLAGRPLSVLFTSGLGVVSTYDAVGRRKTETTHGLAVNSDYDKAGNREWLTWSDGFQVRYGYDNAGLLEKIIEPVSSGLTNDQLVGFSYDGLGRRTQATKGNGTVALWGYDGAGRLESLHQGGFAGGLPLWQDYAYNPASQITELSQNNFAVVWSGQPNATTSTSYNGLNQDGAIAILNSDCHAAGAGYDCNGNMLTDGSRHFAYDAENRLVTVKDADNALKLSIAYDPLGRILQTVGSGATTRFVYDGDRLIGEYAGGVFLRRYVHGVGVDEPLVWYQGAARTDRRWLHADRQGSIVAYSYLGGTTKYYAYGPYGEVQDWADSRFRYTGQIALPEAELFHYKARVYDPKLGRFLQTDPIGYKSDPNLYAYVSGDPLNRNDPTGLLDDRVKTVVIVAAKVIETGSRIPRVAAMATAAVAAAPIVAAAVVANTVVGSSTAGKEKDETQKFYHRRESPTQTAEDAAKQQATGQIWGTTARGGSVPSVKAYVGRLPEGVRGVEFATPWAPEPGQAPHQANWYQGSLGVHDAGANDGREFVYINVMITKNTQIP